MVIYKDTDLANVSDKLRRASRGCGEQVQEVIIPVSAQSVSYTHLDVYKRQQVPHCGHSIYLERPESWVTAVRAFISGQESHEL